MLAILSTKPLQGTLFTQMWDKILNLPCITSPAVHRSVLDLQILSTENNEQLTNGQEADGEVNPIRDNMNKTGNVPARKMTIKMSIGNWVGSGNYEQPS